ncbi:MAG TPA: SPOR domain-containing protein [Acidobacteriaceae bacterium]|nr:SPOR domain-containing protein [Acidobacteriaceae bacterium]
MSRLLDDDEQLEQRDRELTLSTGAILGIFLGLVLLCAVFFGFGYNLGRKSTTIANSNVPASTDDNSAAAETNFDNFKPSAATNAAKPTPAADVDDNPAPATPTPVKTTVASTTSSAPTKPAPTAARPQPVAATPSRTASAESATPAGSGERQTPQPAVAPGGAFVVQVAAISHKEDADLLVTALRGKGYAVAARPSDQDKLLHIQVGPFATRKDAEAMRERLIVDGYNAIVK